MATPPSDGNPADLTDPLLPPPHADPSPHVESVIDPSPHAKLVPDAVLIDSTDPLLPPPKSVPDPLLERRMKIESLCKNIEPERNRI